MSISLQLPPPTPDTRQQLDALVIDQVASRLFAHDPTLWGVDAEAEASIRLGWTDVFARAETLIPEIAELRDAFVSQGVDRIVLCGMGGSSLAPEVITRRAGAALTVLDSTHPTQVRRAVETDLDRTAVVVSSKSGSTIETRSHLAAFEAAFNGAGIDPGSRIVVVTDPGSALQQHAEEIGERVFLADPHVGGRYSALTAFGLVPSGLAGVDLAALLAEARLVADRLAADDVDNPGLRLGAALAQELPDRYTLPVAEAADAAWGLGDWIEQLIAESTGKNGLGVLPIAVQPLDPEARGELSATAVLAVVAEADPGDAPSDAIAATAPLGAQMLLWEVATAVLGRLIGIDPFNQPDVESAKIAARAVLGETSGATPAIGVLSAVPETSLLAAPEGADIADAAGLAAAVRDAVGPEDYVVVQAYLDREGGEAQTLHELRRTLARTLGVSVASGFGPRYLHSTGQFHKGGPARGVFLQILDEATPDLKIPEADSSFGVLLSAQAQGDREVLAGQGRPVFAVRTADPGVLIHDLLDALRAAGARGAGA